MSLPALCTLRRARIGLLLAALSLLSACAMVRLAYNNADTVLRVMAQENRDMRMIEAERRAAGLPPKLTVPMVAFFLPVLFAVILGPAIIRVMQG